MDILYTKSVSTFCLVSSDCDFTPLVLRLRADGKQVIGFGDAKTPSPFVASCTRFLYLDDEKKAKVVQKDKSEPSNELKGNTKLMNTLRNAVKATEGDDGWSNLGVVGNHIQNQGSFDSRNYGFAKLSELFAAIDKFEIRKTKNGNLSTLSVRLRN